MGSNVLYRCDQCSKEFSTLASLEWHKRYTHGGSGFEPN